MGTTKIGKAFRFEAAHRLLDFPEDHKCHRMHGHSYKVLVVLKGEVSNNGTLTDFANIAREWQTRCFSKLDHQYLNNVMNLRNTTAELISMWIYDQLSPMFSLDKVVVWETENAYAEYSLAE